MKRQILLLATLFFACLHGFGQIIENVRTNTQGNNVIITYDLLSDIKGQRFTVEVRSSINNYTTVLKEVTGDVGPDQTAGYVKGITWAALREQGNFSGSVSFEVSAILTFDPLRISAPAAGTKARLGKTMAIEWQGGDKDRNLKMAIIQGVTTMHEIPDVGSSGSFTWNIPKTIAKGEHYQVKLFDPINSEQTAMSAEFNLKKTSLLVYIIPGAIVAGVVTILILGSDNGAGNPLPGPPGLPDG